MSQHAIIAAAALTLLGLGAVLIWAAFRSERKRGAAEAERDQFQMRTELARRANEIDEDVSRLSDANLDWELRDR